MCHARPRCTHNQYKHNSYPHGAVGSWRRNTLNNYTNILWSCNTTSFLPRSSLSINSNTMSPFPQWWVLGGQEGGGALGFHPKSRKYLKSKILSSSSMKPGIWLQRNQAILATIHLPTNTPHHLGSLCWEGRVWGKHGGHTGEQVMVKRKG